MKNILSICCVCSVLAACTSPVQQDGTQLFSQEDFPNLIRIKNVPEQPGDYGLYLFSDQGAWSGYALPENESSMYAGAFIGPMVMTGRGWTAQSLATPTLMVNGEKYDLVRNVQTVKYLPGKLIQTYKDERLKFVTELCFSTSRTASVRSVITNLDSEPLSFSLTWNGGVFEKASTLTPMDKGVCINYPFFSTARRLSFPIISTSSAVGKHTAMFTSSAGCI